MLSFLKQADSEPLVLRQAISACRRFFVNAAMFSALLNILYLAPTIYMLQVYDRVVPTRGVLTLILLTLVLVFAVMTLGGLDFVRARLLVRASARLDLRLTGPILSALLKPGRGTRAATAMREFDTFRQTLTGPAMLALFDAPWAPIYIIVCFLLHPLLGTIALVGALVLLALTLANERATKSKIQNANSSAQMAYNDLDISVRAAETIRALGMRSAMVRRHLIARIDSVQLQSDASFASSGYVTATKAVRLFLQSLALGAGAYLAIEQKISGGAIFAASLLVTRALGPIEQVLGAWKGIIQARQAHNTLIELFSRDGEDTRRTWLPAPQGALEVQQLAVANPERDRLLLRGVGFRLAPGQALGIVGPSGAGKSTLCKALVGALEAQNGVIRFDGAALADWPEEQLWAEIGYVPQEATLFRGTVRQNIARFQSAGGIDDRIVDEAVIAAAQLAGAHDMILRLPKGYDTELGYGGIGLSVGQGHRVALARALYGNPHYVVMDEPNANLDAEGEAKLMAAIAELKSRGATVIIVAHRTSILANVDLLMLMRDGQIEMMGPREEVTQRLQNNARTGAVAPAAPVA